MRKPCERCEHAIPIPHSGLHCSRSGGWYRCEDERALGWVAAHAYFACGATGRFFSERTDARGRRWWNTAVAETTRPLRTQG
jgi:hypothetical protein